MSSYPCKLMIQCMIFHVREGERREVERRGEKRMEEKGREGERKVKNA